MSHFIYADTQPYGICQRCTRNEQLWIITELFPGSDLTGFLCHPCLTELATFADFILGDEHRAKIETLEKVISEQEAQIEIIPNLLEGLTENVNDLISNFVTDLAGVTVSTIIVQPEGDKADTGDTPKKSRGSSKAN